jgi:hypothetical protein
MNDVSFCDILHFIYQRIKLASMTRRMWSKKADLNANNPGRQCLQGSDPKMDAT